MADIRSGNHAQLERFLENCDNAGVTPMIWGAFAIGKSAAVYRFAEKKAKRLGRQFKVWHRMTSQERTEAFESQPIRESLYILYDNRAASNDSTDDKGLPNINNPDYLSWIQNQVYNVFSLPGAAGALFNDEINLAPTLVQNSMYKMVYDRAVGDISFVDDIFIICAGNRVQDRAFVQETPWPLRTRMLHFVLEMASPPDQITFFINADIDVRLIAFFKIHEDLMFYLPDEDSGEMTASTPRSIELASKTMKPLDYGNDIEREDIDLLACGALSTYVGEMFSKFMVATTLVDIDSILRDPQRADRYDDLDSQYGIVTLLVNRYKRDLEPEKGLFGKILEIYKHIPEEIGILLFRLILAVGRPRFNRCMLAFPKSRDILVDMAQYLLDES